MKYAIGEIILVVMGILIALQINTCNDNRKNRSSEKQYLSQITRELSSDTISIQGQLVLYNSKIPIIQNLLSEFQKNDNITSFNQAMNDYINTVWQPPRFKSNKASFEELKLGGNLEIISDDQLRNQIITLYVKIESIEEYITEVASYMRPQDIDFTANKGMAQFLRAQQPMFSEYSSSKDLYKKKKFKNEFISNAANHYWQIKDLVPEFESNLKEVILVLNRIDKHLKKIE